MRQDDDIQIVNLLFARQESGLKKLEEKYNKYCLTIANRILFDNEDSKECVNDAWLKIWNSIPPNRPENLAGYLAKIVRNLALNCYEKMLITSGKGAKLSDSENAEVKKILKID